MGMRIVWGMHDTLQPDGLAVLFEAENLLDGYRDYCLQKWWDEQIAPIPLDSLPDDAQGDVHGWAADRKTLLGKGYDTWRSEQIYGAYPRFTKTKYELWNSVPPNVERLVMHFDS